MELNDELLCAYLDGELDDAQQARVAAALEADAGGRVRLERMRVADARLRREVPPLVSPGTDPIAEFIRRHESQPVAAPVRARRWTVPAAIAAGIFCVGFGFVLSRISSTPADLGPGNYAAGELRAALETRASGERGGAVSVLLTMMARDGAVCRLFESRAATNDGEGVACRDARGWRVVAWDHTVPVDGGFHTAGASPLLDLVMDRLDATPLDPAQERALLARAWRAPR